MRDYKSICNNCKFILSNFNYLDYDQMIEFNSIVNYWVDRVIECKFDKKFRS
jgi:hypothetical protein